MPMCMSISISVFNHLCVYEAEYEFTLMSNSHPYDMGHSSVLLLIIYNLLLQQGPTFAQYVLCNLAGDALPLGGRRPVCPFKWTLELCSSDRAWSTMLISQKRLPGGHGRESLRLRAPTASSLLTIKPVGTSGWGIKHTHTHTHSKAPDEG